MSDFEKAKKLFFEALDFIDASNFTNAELRLREALQLSPENGAILTNLAVALQQQGKRPEARECAERALSAKSDNIEALLVLAESCAYDEHLSEALAAYDKIISLEPTIAEAHNNRGVVLKRLGRAADALESYDRALACNPNLSDAYLNRADALDEPEEALTEYDRAIALNSAATHAWLGRGNACCKLRRYDEGFTAYEKALAQQPELAEAWLGRGNALRDLRRYDEAIAAYDKAIALKPNFAEAWLGRGHVFYDRRRYDEALAS